MFTKWITFDIILLIILFVFVFSTQFSYSGIDNWFTRKMGGESRIILPKGEKLINITFIKGSLWYLTSPRKNEEHPKCYKFREQSMFEIFEGTITICEQ